MKMITSYLMIKSNNLEIEMKQPFAACHRGNKQENYIIGEYKVGGDDFAANWMRDNIHPTDIVFNAAAFSPNVKIQGYTDGMYFDGSTMFIIEMKSGKRYAKKYYVQVMRYARAMMHTVDYDRVEIHTIYSDIKDVDVIKFDVSEVAAEYDRVKDDEHSSSSIVVDIKAVDNTLGEAISIVKWVKPDTSTNVSRLRNAEQVIRTAEALKTHGNGVLTNADRAVISVREKRANEAKKVAKMAAFEAAKDTRTAERDAQLVARTVRPKNSRERALYTSTLSY